MNETIEQLIQARFDAVANQVDDSAWSDVLARARSAPSIREKAPRRRTARPIRFALAGGVAVVALAASAVAFGWPGTVVDFFTARPAPESVKQFFDAHKTALPHGLNPDTKLGQPRMVMTATFDANNSPPTNPTQHTLYLAPTETGGFCYLWTDYGGGCADAEDASAATTNPGARPFGVEWLAGDYATFTDGYVHSDVQTVQARFADGTKVTLPVTWVSAPINAGFFAYVVPSAHQTTSDALSSVVALDANGNVIGQDSIGVTQPLDQSALQTLPDGAKYSLPRRAQAAHAREIVNFHTASGSHVYLWVMPRTGGGHCYLYRSGAGGGLGCVSPSQAAGMPAINGGVSGNGSIYFAQVKPGVASLELRFQNSRSERFTPVDGFVLAAITPGHGKAAGARLVSAVGLDRNGKVLSTQNLRRWHPVFLGGGG
jgi:hypothetical protein